jgi:hypothetical protein
MEAEFYLKTSSTLALFCPENVTIYKNQAVRLKQSDY